MLSFVAAGPGIGRKIVTPEDVSGVNTTAKISSCYNKNEGIATFHNDVSVSVQNLNPNSWQLCELP
jgi:hypothetical protein